MRISVLWSAPCVWRSRPDVPSLGGRDMHLRSSLALVGAFALAACSGAAAPSPTPVGAASPAPAAAEAGSPIAAAAVVPYRCADRDVTWDGTTPLDRTGPWAGDAAGVYYLRQIGDQVWWLGTSGLGGP